jgi:hypothetical protein
MIGGAYLYLYVGYMHVHRLKACFNFFLTAFLQNICNRKMIGMQVIMTSSWSFFSHISMEPMVRVTDSDLLHSHISVADMLKACSLHQCFVVILNVYCRDTLRKTTMSLTVELTSCPKSILISL